MLENTINNNVQYHSNEPTVLIHELSSIEYYVGTSNNGNTKSAAIWKLKKIIKIDNVWYIQYPNGIQNFTHIWNDRLTYDYD